MTRSLEGRKNKNGTKMIRKLIKSDLPQMLKIWNANYKVLTSSQKRHTIKSLENWYETRTKINHEYFGMLEGKLEYFGTSNGKVLKSFAILKSDNLYLFLDIKIFFLLVLIIRGLNSLYP